MPIDFVGLSYEVQQLADPTFFSADSRIELGGPPSRGGIHVLAATTTLAAGINTPASTVVLAENEFVGEDGRPFTVAEYKNMAAVRSQ